jgi:hypothetical protein
MRVTFTSLMIGFLCLSAIAADEADLLIGRWRLVPYFRYHTERIDDQTSLRVKEYPDHDETAIIEFVSRDQALLIDDYASKETAWKIEPSGDLQWSITLAGQDGDALILDYIRLGERTLLFNLYSSDEVEDIVSGIMKPDSE